MQPLKRLNQIGLWAVLLLVVPGLAAWIVVWVKYHRAEESIEPRAALSEYWHDWEMDLLTKEGRAAPVSVVKLISEPQSYHGKRVILSGIWTFSAFSEQSSLSLENNAQNFTIFVQPDWWRIEEEFGDFSRRATHSRPAHQFRDEVRVRITGKGTFGFADGSVTPPAVLGYSWGYEGGLFLLDRLFEYEVLSAKDSPQKTSSE